MMNDEKFDEIMKNWVSHEIESTPQLRPKKEMYQMVKAKKQKVFFPVFARWATIGAAAVYGITHPELIYTIANFALSRKRKNDTQVKAS